jgi:hypothetical protein
VSILSHSYVVSVCEPVMPLKLGNRRDVEVDIVPGLEGEVGGPLDDQVHHLGGEDDACGDVALALRRNFWTSI